LIIATAITQHLTVGLQSKTSMSRFSCQRPHMVARNRWFILWV